MDEGSLYGKFEYTDSSGYFKYNVKGFSDKVSMWDVDLRGISLTRVNPRQEALKRGANFVVLSSDRYIYCKLPDEIFNRFKGKIKKSLDSV
jgi:hypothetical protein